MGEGEGEVLWMVEGEQGSYCTIFDRSKVQDLLNIVEIIYVSCINTNNYLMPDIDEKLKNQ